MKGDSPVTRHRVLGALGAALIVGVAALAACGVTLEGAVDGAPDAAEATAPDAPDAGLDATNEDGPGPDAPSVDGGSFCANRGSVAYCEDFDRETDLAKLVFPETSAVELAPTMTGETFRSPPRAIAFGIPADAPQSSYTVFKKPFGRETTLRVELDMFVDAAPRVGSLQSVTWKRLGPQFSIGRTCVDDSGGITCGWFVARCVTSTAPCDAVYPWPSPPFEGKWGRIFLEVRMATAGHLAFGTVGEPPVVDLDVEGYLSKGDASAATVLTVGIANVQGPSPAFAAFFDGIVVTER